MTQTWRIRLTHQAESDLFEILTWTMENFGTRQAEHYAEVITSSIKALQSGLEVPGVRARDDIDTGIHTLHVARKGKKGRHFIVFKVADEHVVEVLRLLHDSMDPIRHVASIKT